MAATDKTEPKAAKASREFPDLVYRAGTGENVRGVMCDTRYVADDDELAAALKEGWSETPPEAKDAKG